MDDHSPDLTAPSWTLVTHRTGDHLGPARGREATLRLAADGAVSGSTGCNRFFGRWEADGGRLTISVAGTTMMACDDTAMAQERAVLDALAAVAAWAVVGRSLVLTDAEGETVLTYTGETSADLAGTAWTVVGVNNGRQAVVASGLTEALSLELGDDGRATGSGGCNTFSGSYEIDGERLAFGPLSVTRTPCPDVEVAALEQQYFDALERSVVAELDGDHLTLRDDGGATQVTLRRAG